MEKYCVKNEMNKQREDGHLKLLKWIDENEDVDFPFKISTKEEWNRFYQSNNKDDIMDMQIIECDEFYGKFKEIIGIDLMKLDNFISMKYIDEAQNDIEIIINVDGINQRFVIGI